MANGVGTSLGLTLVYLVIGLGTHDARGGRGNPTAPKTAGPPRCFETCTTQTQKIVCTFKKVKLGHCKATLCEVSVSNEARASIAPRENFGVGCQAIVLSGGGSHEIVLQQSSINVRANVYL